jgi:hypothetical protein
MYGHSMVGFRGTYSALRDPDRFPTGWHDTTALDGTIYQHYPVWAGLAHAGPLGNPYGTGGESEGGFPAPYNQPITDAQVIAWVRKIRDMESFTGRTYRRGVYRRGFVEHGEVAQTGCPSGRYAKLYAAIDNGALDTTDWEVAMASAEYNELRADLNKAMALIAANGWGDVNEDGAPDLVGAAAWAAAVENQGSLFLGLGNTQRALGRLTVAVEQLTKVVAEQDSDSVSEAELAAVFTRIAGELADVQNRLTIGYTPNNPIR